jgi:hypothetical protein
MTFLPIVERELRVRARWRSTYVVRAAIAVVVIAITIVMMLFVGIGGPGAVGKGMLLTLGWIAFAFAVVEGFRATADSLSEEKREGTLGLLFLTDLKGYDVVLGKFVAGSLSSFYGLIAVVPALSIPVLLGGVTGAEFWRVVLALLNALFVSLATGIFVSAISRHERRAWTATVLLVIVPVVLFPILAASLPAPLLLCFSPASPMISAFQPGYSAAASSYWNSLWVTNLLGWAALIGASVLLPRMWRESDRGRLSRKSGLGSIPQSDPVERRVLLNANPMRWLASRGATQKRSLWIVVAIAVLAGVATWTAGEGEASVAAYLFLAGVILHFIISVWVATEACYSFADARSSGAMELVLSTPLSVRQIVRGQQLAIMDLFFRPVLVLVSVEVGLLLCQIGTLSAGQKSAWESVTIFLVAIFAIGWFLLDLVAISRAGMWFSLTSQKPTHALTKTIGYVLVLPAMLLPCCSIIGPGLMVAKSVIFLTWAQSKLEREFRNVAAGRFDGGSAGGWKKPGKLLMPGR